MGGDETGIVLRPSGDLDVATVAEFRTSVQEALATEPAALVIDLADVEFLDSSGLAVLAVVLRTQRARAAACAVVNPHRIVRRAIELVGLDVLFDVDGVPAHLLDGSAR
jgi:anti-sigma B factor antagonist